MAGIPPMAGFIGKLIILNIVIDNNLFFLAIIAVITSVNFMNIVLQKRHQEPRKILNSLYLMEAFKFLLTGVFFGVAIILIKAMFFPLIIGYIVAVFIYWLSLLAA